MTDKIKISVSGPSKSGKTTVIQEIVDALAKAGIVDVRVVMRASGWRKDYITQGKALDGLAERVRNEDVEISVIEEETSRFDDFDVTF